MWFNRDPAGYHGTNNLYQFARTQPTNNTDPFGLFECKGWPQKHDCDSCGWVADYTFDLSSVRTFCGIGTLGVYGYLVQEVQSTGNVDDCPVKGALRVFWDAVVHLVGASSFPASLDYHFWECKADTGQLGHDHVEFNPGKRTTGNVRAAARMRYYCWWQDVSCAGFTGHQGGPGSQTTDTKPDFWETKPPSDSGCGRTTSLDWRCCPPFSQRCELEHRPVFQP